LAKRIKRITLSGVKFARKPKTVGDPARGILSGIICLNTNGSMKLTKLMVQKAKVKRGVVYDKLGVLNKLEQFISNLLKPRLVHEALIGKPVNLKGTRVDLALGIQIIVKPPS
jgi:hypothetical protein